MRNLPKIVLRTLTAQEHAQKAIREANKLVSRTDWYCANIHLLSPEEMREEAELLQDKIAEWKLSVLKAVGRLNNVSLQLLDEADKLEQQES